MYSNTIGNYNTATGWKSLYTNGSGGYNTAVGYMALFTNASGNYNSSFGHQSLNSNTASGNTALGYRTLYATTSGGENTAVGYNALLANTTGTRNTAVGYGADVGGGAYTNATAIGYGAVATGSNIIRLGNDSITHVYAKVAPEIQSDRNEKERIRPLDGERILSKLRNVPVFSWNYKGQDPRKIRHYGPMAQDFYAAFGHDGLGTVGSPKTVNLGDVDGVVLGATQELERRTALLQAENARLRARLAEIEGRLGLSRPTAPRSGRAD